MSIARCCRMSRASCQSSGLVPNTDLQLSKHSPTHTWEARRLQAAAGLWFELRPGVGTQADGGGCTLNRSIAAHNPDAADCGGKWPVCSLHLMRDGPLCGLACRQLSSWPMAIGSL